MADRVNIPVNFEGQTITIKNAPASLQNDRDELRRIARSAIDQGKTEVDYFAPAPAEQQQERTPLFQRAQEEQQRVISDAQRLREAEQNLPPAPLSARAQAEELTRPRTTAGGVLGGVARGLGPYAAGAAVGAPFGPVGVAGGVAAVGLTKALSRPVTNLTNRILGTNFEDPKEAAQALFTQMGFAEPDTAAEQFAQDTSAAVGDTLAMISGGNLLAAGAPVLGGAQTVAQGAGQTVAANPAQQAIGAVGGTTGSELAGQGVDALNRNEDINIGPGVKAGLQFLGGMAGDIASSSFAPGGNILTHPSQQNVDTFQADMRNARQSPELVREAVRQGQEPAIRSLMNELGVSREVATRAVQANSGFLSRVGSRVGLADSDISALAAAGVDPQIARDAMGRARNVQVDIFRTDAAPPSDQLEIGSQRTREALGGSRVRGQQGRARNARLDTVINEFDLAPGGGRYTTDPVTGETPLISQQLADSFAEGRQTALNTYNQQWTEALDTVPEDARLPVDNAITYLDDQIEKFRAAGDTTTDVNVPQTPGANAEAEAGMRNMNQGIISRLEQYKAVLQNKRLEDLELNRRQLREIFKPSDPNAPVDPNAQVYRGLYTALRDDMAEAVRVHGGDEAYERFIDAGENLNAIHDQLNSEALRELVKRYSRDEMKVEANPDIIYRVATSDDPEIVRDVMNMMDDNGQRLVETAVVQDIMERSTENIRDVSPNRFANYLHEQLEQRGVPMTEERRELLKGTEILLDMTRRPEDMLRQQPVDATANMTRAPGMRYGLARLIFHNIVVGGGLVAGTMLSMRNLSTLYESPQMRDTLLELAETGGKAQRAEELTRTLIRGLINPDVQQSAQEAAPRRQMTSEALTETQFRSP
jgi:hypothetical protein